MFQGVHETICYGPCDQPWKDEESKMNQVSLYFLEVYGREVIAFLLSLTGTLFLTTDCFHWSRSGSEIAC